MSVNLLLLFSSAMITAIVAKVTASPGGWANIACLSLLALFAVLTHVKGIRKPVI